jgi:hypothetical protein
VTIERGSHQAIDFMRLMAGIFLGIDFTRYQFLPDII